MSNIATLTIEEKRQKRKERQESEFYVQPKLFNDELRKFYASSVISDSLTDIVMKMVRGVSSSSNFSGYSFKEDVIGESYVAIIKALHKRSYSFERDLRGNPFVYFNTIIHNCWRLRIKTEKKRRDSLEKYKEELTAVARNHGAY